MPDTLPANWLDARARYAAAVPASTKRPVRDLSVISTICIHHAGALGATLDGFLSWFGQNSLGYHIIVNTDGQVWVLSDINHVQYHNGAGESVYIGGLSFSKSNWTQVGICLNGSFIEGRVPSNAQLAGVKGVIAWVWSRLGRQVPIKGHKDFYATQCPGDWWTKGTTNPLVVPSTTPAPPSELDVVKKQLADLTVQMAVLQAKAAKMEAAMKHVLETAQRAAGD